MRKNLAVFGADDWALAKPLNGAAKLIHVHPFAVWLFDDPAEADPIEKRVPPRVMDCLFVADHRK